MITVDQIMTLIDERISRLKETMREIAYEAGTSCAEFSMEMGAHDEMVSLKEEIESAE